MKIYMCMCMYVSSGWKYILVDIYVSVYILCIAYNICICVGVYVYVQKYYISSIGAKYVNYDCHRFPHRFHRVQKCSHSWLSLGSISSLVCGAVVAHVPSEHALHLCSDKCAFIVYCAGGVRKIMLVVTGDHHAVLANIIGYIAPTPPPLPMICTTQGFSRVY